MARSEALASFCAPLWAFRAGHRSALPAWFPRVHPDDLESPLVQRILARLDEFAGRWHALPPGGSLTVSWPVRPVTRPATRPSHLTK